MTPIDQYRFGPEGNCFAACVASLLELPLAECPNFCAIPGDWFGYFRTWLASRGYGAIMFDWAALGSGRDAMVRGTLIIAGGMSARGYLHAVLWRDGVLVHDPHPDRTGIDTVVDVTLLFPLDPGSFVLRPCAASTPGSGTRTRAPDRHPG